MQNKIIAIIVILLCVIGAYIILAVTLPAGRELVETAATELEASANMDNFPGTLGVVETAPLWIWFLPGIVGVIATVMVLRPGNQQR